MCKSQGYEKLSESIVEYDVSCLGPKGNCKATPGWTFDDIEEFVFWGSMFVIAMFPFVYIMVKKTRQKRNFDF